MIRRVDLFWQSAAPVLGAMEGVGPSEWIDEVDLNCGALLQEFDRDRVSKNRFEVMQSHEAAVDE